jgi:hypothetical protein
MSEGDSVTPDDVWHQARIKRNKGEPTEEEVSPAAFLQELETEQDAIRAKLDLILEEIQALSARNR